jgi:hypothetical protein
MPNGNPAKGPTSRLILGLNREEMTRERRLWSPERPVWSNKKIWSFRVSHGYKKANIEY